MPAHANKKNESVTIVFSYISKEFTLARLDDPLSPGLINDLASIGKLFWEAISSNFRIGSS